MKETIGAKKLLKQFDLTVNKELVGPFSSIDCLSEKIADNF